MLPPPPPLKKSPEYNIYREAHKFLNYFRDVSLNDDVRNMLLLQKNANHNFFQVLDLAILVSIYAMASPIQLLVVQKITIQMDMTKIIPLFHTDSL